MAEAIQTFIMSVLAADSRYTWGIEMNQKFKVCLTTGILNIWCTEIALGILCSTVRHYARSQGLATVDLTSIQKIARIFDVLIEDLIETIEE